MSQICNFWPIDVVTFLSLLTIMSIACVSEGSSGPGWVILRWEWGVEA